MPFKSKRQRRFMLAAESRGEIPKGTAREWAAETPSIPRLPERKRRARRSMTMPDRTQRGRKLRMKT